MLLYRAVRERREKNLTIDELDAYVRSIIQSQCHWFIVDDLNHLKRGGRVRRWSARCSASSPSCTRTARAA